MPTLEKIKPRAVPRSPGANTFATDAVARAGIAAPPAACTMRPKTSSKRFGASAQKREPAANTRRPKQKVHLRLKRSETRPVEGDADGVDE
jgi:hypothetical protein